MTHNAMDMNLQKLPLKLRPKTNPELTRAEALQALDEAMDTSEGQTHIYTWPCRHLLAVGGEQCPECGATLNRVGQ